MVTNAKPRLRPVSRSRARNTSSTLPNSRTFARVPALQCGTGDSLQTISFQTHSRNMPGQTRRGRGRRRHATASALSGWGRSLRSKPRRLAERTMSNTENRPEANRAGLGLYRRCVTWQRRREHARTAFPSESYETILTNGPANFCVGSAYRLWLHAPGESADTVSAVGRIIADRAARRSKISRQIRRNLLDSDLCH